MKRLFVTLLLGALLLGLLCACAEQPNSDAPTDAPPRTLQPKEITITPGGVAVHSDYSAYTPRTAGAADPATRLSDAPLPDLQAREDYGEIFPYVVRVGAGDYGEELRYGFADAQGRVIADPVYLDVFCKWNAERTQGLWVYRKLFVSDFTGSDGETYHSGEEYYGFAALDGSFVSDCCYARICAGNHIFMAIRPTAGGEKPEFDVYDYSGQLLTTSEALLCADELGGSWWEYNCVGDYLAVSKGTGEFLDCSDYVMMTGGEERIEITEIYLVDLEGNYISGPFSGISGWEGDYPSVSMPDYSWGLLDRDGQLLFGRSFRWICCDAPDRFTVVESSGDDYKILNAAGEPVFTIPAEDAQDGLGFDGLYYVLYGEFGSCVRVDCDGNPVAGLSEGEWGRISGTRVFCRQDSETEWSFYNAETGETLTRDLGMYSFVYTGLFATGTVFPYFVVTVPVSDRYDEEQNVTLYNEQLEPVMEFYGSFHVLLDEAKLTPYFVVKADGKQTFYTMSLERWATLSMENTADARIYNGRITYCNDRAAYVYDMEGNLIFSCPTYRLLED